MGQSDIYTLAWSSLDSRPQNRVWISVQDPQGDIGSHDHVFHEIALVTRGRAEHHTSDGVMPLAAGDLIVIRPQVWHSYQKCRDFAVTNCLIEPRLLYQMLPLLGEIPAAVELFRRQTSVARRPAPRVLHAHPAVRPVIAAIIDAMLHEQQRQSPGWQAIAHAKLLELLGHVLRLMHSPPPAKEPTSRTEAGVLAAAHWIETHQTEELSLAMLARVAGMSPGHLSRHFARRMGMGIVKYQHRLRAQEACRLLRLTDLPITDIALRLGYLEIAYFSRCFRRHTGLSARDFRKGTRTA